MTGSADRARIEWHRLGTFLAALVALAGLTVLVASVTEVRPAELGPLYMLTPAIATVLVAARCGLDRRSVGIRRGRPRWIAIAGVASLPILGLTLGLALLVPGISLVGQADPIPGIVLPEGPLGFLVVIAFVFAGGLTVNAILALGEEVGWRGYLLWELAPLGFWPASILVGAMWGIWHAPIVMDGYNFPAFPLVGVLMMTGACICFAPVYTYLVLRARSVFAAVVLHGVFNAGAGMVIVYTRAEGAILEELVANPVGLAGAGAFVLLAAGIAIAGAPELSRSSLDRPG